MQRTPCKTLGGTFALREEPEIGLALRLFTDDGRLVLTPAEARELALRAEIARLESARSDHGD